MGIGTKILDATADGALHAVADIATAIRSPRKNTVDACNKLANHGLLHGTTRGEYQITDHGLTALHAGGLKSGPKGPHAAPASPKKAHARQRVWNALRIKGKATMHELAILSSNGQQANPYDNVRKYVFALIRCGYVARLARRTGGDANIQPITLLRDTGDLAPVVQLNKRGCWDQNIGQFFGFEEVQP